MRIDPKELPLRYQEQLGTAILAQLTETPPVAVREEKYVRNLRPHGSWYLSAAVRPDDTASSENRRKAV